LSSQNPGTLTRTLRGAEILFYHPMASYTDPTNPTPEAQLAVPVTLTMCPGRDSVRSNHIDTSTIGIFKNQAGRQVLVPGSAYNSQTGCASAPITQSAVYYLNGQVQSLLDSAHVFPNPFKPSLGHQTITFSNLGADSSIRIYTIMGELVQELHSDNIGTDMPWGVKNRDGDKVASGVYIYQIKNAYSEKRGKLIIIR
jgi:hypothetical protein